jgi:hypothetical protein
MKNKKMILAAVALVAVVALMLGLYFIARPKAQTGGKNITIEVVHEDGSVKTVKCATDAEVLGPVLEAENLVAYEEGPYGMFISEVDGERAVWEENGAYWALYEGDEYATAGADTLVIADGGVYKLVFTVG